VKIRNCLLAIALGVSLTGCATLQEKLGLQKPADGPAKPYQAPEERYVFFASSKADAVPDGYFAIGYVAAQLDQATNMHVLVVGHADSKGKAADNVDLAFKRARVVRKILMDHGVAANRILVAAPKSGNEEVSPALSRRVDMFVYDPVQDEASTRLGYPVDVKAE
jgi:outer membrane protein OmpA-like peptidoglycan-associated protein